ncbi:unnamed protein product [Citrullus colocynthis]|uniref:Uncharacterized protein n=1 Tax=Citrullus colocynthis TaxID=252529 RepID=A0ABP0YKT5_9ROSI
MEEGFRRGWDCGIFGHCIGVEEFLLLLYWSKGSGRALFLNFAGDPTGFSRAPILLFISLNALTSVQTILVTLIAKGRGVNRLCWIPENWVVVGMNL